MPGFGWVLDRTSSSTSRSAFLSYTRPLSCRRGARSDWCPCPSATLGPCEAGNPPRGVVFTATGSPTGVPAAAHSSTACTAAQAHVHRYPLPRRALPRGHGHVRCCAASASSQGGSGSAFGDPNTLVGMLMAYAVQLQQQQQQQGGAKGSEVRVEGIGFHPPGSEKPLLQDVSLVLPANNLGLVMGRSGSGKTTLLQVLAGLTEQTSGQVRILSGLSNGTTTGGPAGPSYGSNGNGNSSSHNGNGYGYVNVDGSGNGNGSAPGGHGTVAAAAGLTVEERMQQVGLVFQFPERHFLGEDLMQELTFTWPRLTQFWGERQAMSMRMQQVLQAVGLEDIPLHVSPWALSGGQQRRLALAIQLVRQPALLLLDEPLAGLDWTSRQEVVTILRKLKEQCTLLVVSHDLAEIAPLVDCAWRMRIGGTIEAVPWPPSDLAGLEQ